MHRITLFVEDFGHESFITALISRLSHEYGVKIEIISRSTTGGRGHLLKELDQYIRMLQRGYEAIADMLIIATDANCQKYLRRRQEVEGRVPDEFKPFIVYAIPDPHIERWLLLDSSAFKAVLGRGCATPPTKCERDLYKRLLIESIRAAGLSPLIGGIEHTEDIVNHMNLQQVGQADDSIGKLLKELQGRFKAWSTANH